MNYLGAFVSGIGKMVVGGLGGGAGTGRQINSNADVEKADITKPVPISIRVCTIRLSSLVPGGFSPEELLFMQISPALLPISTIWHGVSPERVVKVIEISPVSFDRPDCKGAVVIIPFDSLSTATSFKITSAVFIASECQSKGAVGIIIQLSTDNWTRNDKPIKKWSEILNAQTIPGHVMLTVPVFCVRNQVAERILVLRREKSGIDFVLRSYQISAIQGLETLMHGRLVDVSLLNDFKLLLENGKEEVDYAQSAECKDYLVTLARSDSFPFTIAMLRVFILTYCLIPE